MCLWCWVIFLVGNCNRNKLIIKIKRKKNNFIYWRKYFIYNIYYVYLIIEGGMFRIFFIFYWDIKLFKVLCDCFYVYLRFFVVIIYKFIIGYRIKVSLNLLKWYVIEVEKKINVIYMCCMLWFVNKVCVCIIMYENKY